MRNQRKCPTCKGCGFTRESKHHAFKLCGDCAGDGFLSAIEERRLKKRLAKEKHHAAGSLLK